MSYAIEQAGEGGREGCLALAAPRYEVIPIRGVMEQARALPHGATVTVTCSPRHGIDSTLDVAAALATAGYYAVPHVAARLVRDRAHLQRILDRLAAAGLHEVFLVGGDAARPVGEFASGVALLETMASMTPRPSLVGVPAYPEGHPLIDDAPLQAALDAKAEYADYAVTQMCFEPRRILEWLARQRERGLRLPVYAGLPGVMERKRLLSVAMRIGLGPSTRALRRQGALLGRLMQSNTYAPDELLWPLAPAVGDPALGLRGFHLYTFNQVAATLAWRDRMLTDMTQWFGVSLEEPPPDTALPENAAAR